MHMPFCTIADKCLRCDNVRAGREIQRLREVLRTTLDAKLALDDEVKDMRNQRDCLQKELESWWYAVKMVQAGKVSVTKLYPPGPELPSDEASGK